MIGNKPDNGAMLALTTAGVEHIYALDNWDNWDLLRFFEKSGIVPAKMVNLELQLT